MKVLFCSSEVFPFAKTGGLADVCGTLPPELAQCGAEVKVMMPLYRQVRENAPDIEEVGPTLAPRPTQRPSGNPLYPQ